MNCVRIRARLRAADNLDVVGGDRRARRSKQASWATNLSRSNTHRTMPAGAVALRIRTDYISGVSHKTAKLSQREARKKIRSAEWKPEKKYEAFEGVLNGGVIGTLLDCHCNWTAAYHLMKHAKEDHPPCTVTAEYAIKLLRPTPTNDSVFLSAKVVDLTDDRATIEGTLTAGGKVCATCRGVFVAVEEGHPAYHRW